MSTLGKITRRTLLVGSTAVAGGVAFGYYSYKKPIDNPLLDELKDGETALNPYVQIDASGVTIITPRADLGQGAYSIQAALVAEELDIAWEDLNVDPGPPSPAYYNGKLAAEAFPFAATDMSIMAKAARAFGEAGGKFMKMQITGGSSTVPDAYEKMRIAGAVARDVLVTAASNRSGIEKSALETKDGQVILPDGSKLSYSSLAKEAASLDLPKNVKLKPEAEWRYLGKPMTRIDIVAKSTGTATYGIDLRMPEMVFATVRTNPRLGGSLKSFDDSSAKMERGVLKIVEITNGVGVIANNTWRAFKASLSIDCEWGEAPYPASQDDQWNEVAASFIEERQDSQFKDEGTVEDALSKGDTFEAEYKVPYLAHAPMEPMNTVVQLKDGRLDIWTGTQVPIFMQVSAAKITGLDQSDVHIHAQLSGGSFGRRLEDDYVRQAVELAMAYEGRPIKMTWTREEDMSHDFPRPLSLARGRGTIENGRVETLDLSIASPSISESQFGRQDMALPGPDIAIVAGAWDQPFKIPNYRVTGFRVPAMVPVSSWRSVGASGNGFFHDCFLDELIHAAGADPLEERLRLCWHEPSRKVLEAVGEMSGWGSDMGPDKGRGVAFTLSFGVPVAEVIEVTNTPDGIRIDKAFVAAEVGKVLDPVNFESQLTGGVIWGLGHAMSAELTYADGMAEQSNFHEFEGLRLYQAPQIEIRALENADEIRGIGEPGVPPAGPALANAIFAATGKRIRELPLNRHIDFV
jgi:isoquinoline 1-oxidoreductase subunit beta